jgi:hypothetical protein
MWLHAIFFLHFLYMPYVQFMPSSKYYSYTSLHCYINPHFNNEHSKHFPNFNWYLDVQEIFKYVMSVIKQSCGQFKHVYILTNLYFKNWIGNYTYWMYLIWCIFHPVKATWLGWWLGEFPYEHPPYMYIVFIASCLEALSKKFHHRLIYLIILQVIRISPLFTACIFRFIVLKSLLFTIGNISKSGGARESLLWLLPIFSWHFVSTLVHSIFSIINFSFQFQPIFILTLVLFHNLLQTMVFFFLL